MTDAAPLTKQGTWDLHSANRRTGADPQPHNLARSRVGCFFLARQAKLGLKHGQIGDHQVISYTDVRVPGKLITGGHEGWKNYLLVSRFWH